MKNRTILILSIILVVLMSLSSCKRIPENIYDTDAPSQEAAGDIAGAKIDEVKKDTDKVETEASSVEKVPDINSEITNEKSDIENKNSMPKNIEMRSDECAYMSPEEIQEKADLIFIGEYTGEIEIVFPEKEFQEKEYGYADTFVHTDCTLNVLNVFKGNIGDDIIIRRAGGATIDDTAYMSSDAPVFEKGKKYLIYACVGKPIVSDDITHYYVISHCCFEVDNAGKVNFSGVRTDDVPKLKAQYETALAASVSKEALDK